MPAAQSSVASDPLLQPIDADSSLSLNGNDTPMPPGLAPPTPNGADNSSLPSAGSGPKVKPGAPGSKMAVISYLAAAALKGIGQGKQISDQVKWAKTKRTMDGLQYSYQVAAQNLEGLTKAGADPKEIEQAKSARDASWQALMGFYSQNVFGEDGKSKKKGKNKGKAQSGQGQTGEDSEANLMAELHSPDPAVKREAYFKLAQKLGPPDEWKLREWSSAQATQRREVQGKAAQSQLEVENKRLRLHELQGKANPSNQEKEELTKLQEDQELFPTTAANATPHYASFDTLGSELPANTVDAMGQTINPKQTYRGVTRGGVTSWVPSVQKSSGKPTIGWAKDEKGKWYSAEIDPATNQFKADTKNYDRVPPPGLLDKEHTSEFTMKDADGNVHRIQTTSTTRPILPVGGTGGSGVKKEGVTPSPSTLATPTPTTSTSTSTSTSPSKPGVPLKAGETGPLGIKQSPGDRIVGNVGAGGQAMSRAAAADSVLNLLPRATELLKDPEVQSNLGVLNGRWSEVDKKIGDLDPKTQEFYGILKSIYAANGTMHGWRSLKAPEEFEKAYGDLHTDPATLTGGLKAVAESAKVFYQTGYKHPWSPQKGTPSTTPGSTPSPAIGGATPKTADDYLKGIGA
jgi:hypothetical protein